MSLYTRECLIVVRNSSPFALVFGATLFTALPTCLVRPSKRTVLNTRQRAFSTRLARILAVLYGFEGTLFVLGQVYDVEWTADEDAVVYASLSCLIWLISYLIYAESDRLYWIPNRNTWILASLLDASIGVLLSQTSTGLFDYVQLVILFFRVLCLTVSYLCLSMSVHKATKRQPERQPLLDPTVAVPKSANEDQDEFSGVETAVDDGNENKVADCYLKKQVQRVEELGGWWRYLQEFKFLFPHLLPMKNRILQLYMMSMFVVMLCSRVANVLLPRLVGNLVDKINAMKQSGEVPWRDIVILVLAVKVPNDIILEQAHAWLSLRVYYWSYNQLFLACFGHIMGLSLHFHDNKQTGEVQAAVEQGMRINMFMDEMFKSLPLLFDTVVAFAYLTHLFDSYVGLILAATYVMYGIVTYKITPWIVRERRRYQATHRFERNLYYESIANWTTAFYFNRQDYQLNRVKESTRKELQEAQRYYDLGQILGTMQRLVIILSYGALLFRAAYLVIKTDRPVGDFVTLLMFHAFLTAPLFKIAHTYNLFIEIYVDAERLLEIVQTQPTVADAENAWDLVYKGGKVEFRNVSFSYDGMNKVIRDLSFEVSPGSTVAFVGQSGSGKTTTCDKLLFRGYDVSEGAILIDGQDIRHVKQRSLREAIGIVRQEQSFYNNSVMEIVRYARLDASDEEIFQACKDAAIHDQILSFPNGYNSRIGERGVKLSGGGRQRLAIAQLFLRDPKIIVLDEATASVDNIIESEIQDSFARICRGRTTLVVAHRLSTVQHADQIFVLDKGTIVERGTHDELLSRRGRYYMLWNKKQAADKLMKLEQQYQTSADQQLIVNLSDDSSENESDDSLISDNMQIDGANEMQNRGWRHFCS